MKIAFCAIGKATDEEAIVLERLLKNVESVVDGIFITITGQNEAVEKVCKEYKATVSHFEWINDFAAARNFNFSQVKDFDYILWADADDSFRGLHQLREELEKHPDGDVFSMNYLYAFDEEKQPIVVHQKTQVVKVGCVEWEGELHEDFKPLRELTRYFLKDIERLHLSDETRFESAKARNVEVAKNQLDKHPDDPRSFWNLGNSLKALGKDEEALEAFSKFLSSSHSDDEKYIVRLRMAESYYGLKKVNEAIDSVRYAIGLKANFPDAYYLLGHFFYNQGRYMEAAEQYLSGLQKPKPYHSIIVFNPRDYDYTPMMNLAKCYFSLGRPDLALPLLLGCQKIYPKNKTLKTTIKEITKASDLFEKVIKELAELREEKNPEKIKEKIESLPIEIQSHPTICKFKNEAVVKTETSGKDLVIFCGFTEEEWTPETAKEKGIGGSEEAVIWLSKLLTDKGWNVTVYNNCGHSQQEFDGVTYKPFWTWNQRDAQDVTVFWRTPRLLDYEINSKKIFVDLHDVIAEGEFTPKRLEKIEKIFVKSKFHRSLFPNIPDEKFVIVPNGIDTRLFENPEKENLIINTSSPDRSLSSYIDIVREVKKELPDVKAQWAYGWGVFDVVYADDQKMLDWKNQMIKDMEDVGIENLGRVSHGQVAEMYKKARIFLYPSEFAEIDCISLTKAIASGAEPITTDFAAMGEKQGHGGVFIKSEKTKDNWCPSGQFDHSIKDKEQKKEFIKKTIESLKTQPSQSVIKCMTDFAKDYDWNLIAERWDKELK